MDNKQRTWYINGNQTRLDASDEIESYFATQAITQAQGRIPCGNIPVTDPNHVQEAKDFVDKMHL